MQILIIHACVAMQPYQTYNLALLHLLKEEWLVIGCHADSYGSQLAIIMCYYTMLSSTLSHQGPAKKANVYYNDQFYSHIVQIQLTNAAPVVNYILLDTVAQTRVTRCYSQQLELQYSQSVSSQVVAKQTEEHIRAIAVYKAIGLCDYFYSCVKL